MKIYNVKMHNVNLTNGGGYSLLVISHIDETVPVIISS